MAEYMRSYMRRWRRTNAQVAAIIESNEDIDEIPNQLGDGENPVRNELDEEIILRDSDDTLHTDETSEFGDKKTLTHLPLTL